MVEAIIEPLASESSVHANHLTRYIARRLRAKKSHERCNLVRFANAAHRRSFEDGSSVCLIFQHLLRKGCVDVPGGNTVQPYTTAAPFAA